MAFDGDLVVLGAVFDVWLLVIEAHAPKDVQERQLRWIRIRVHERCIRHTACHQAQAQYPWAIAWATYSPPPSPSPAASRAAAE